MDRLLIVLGFTAATIVLTLLAACNCPGADWELLPGLENDVDLTVRGSMIDIRTTGSDPYVVGSWDNTRRDDDRVLQLEYFCSDPIDSFYGYTGPPIRESSRVDLPKLAVAQGWQTYVVDLHAVLKMPLLQSATLFRFDFGGAPNVRLQIRNIQLRPLTPQERREIDAEQNRRREKVSRAARIVEYLEKRFDHQLDVGVEQESVVISMSAPEPASGSLDPPPFELVEFSPQHSIGDAPGRCQDCQARLSDGRWVFTVPRRVDGRDRLHSGWQIRMTDSGSVLTARHYAARIVPDSTDHATAPARPKSQKGLSGFSRRGPQSDLLELGVHGVTINLVLNRFLSTTPGPGKTAIDVAGPSVYFDDRMLPSHDRLIDFARQHEIVVSAIVLIPRSKRETAQSPLAHPQSDGGVYAMPDLDSPRGVKIYSHVLERIAHRYRNSQRSPGAISNWIAHNEVDFHPVWTNMGRQPRPVCTETYYRSMRMIHNASVAHNPHARVFASLTHHWTVPEDGSWGQLAPREVLETLQRYSQLEGDFAWGVAYHPYPESLFAEVAWKDKNISNDFDTPLITIQNIDVLGRFLQQPSMRDARGNVRPVLLSEQGFHTDTGDDEAQAQQAGSLWYAMKKIRSLSFVESFHYHRWIDHPDEGGLMLGLRTLPSKNQPYGRPKRSWYVYQGIGTDQEAVVTAGLPQP
jgi:hypothetical protein